MQVALSFGPYPTNVEFDKPGLLNCDELGLIWLKHVAEFSRIGMLYNHSLILLVPKETVIPEDCQLEKWGSVKRFSENSKVEQWPLGPNLIFQQFVWLQYNKKISGPFLWCEPDCVPVVPDWLEKIDEEYRRCGKPFMGALVEAQLANKTKIPRHMTGNAVYPNEAYKLAPKILEARMTPWDVYAAAEILPHAYFTAQIQHEYRHAEIADRRELANILKSETTLFHSDKYGAIARIFGRPELPRTATPKPEAPEVTPSPEPMPSMDTMLEEIINYCHFDLEFRKKVAYKMLEYNVVNRGHLANYGKMKKKLEAARDAAQEPEPEPAEPAA
jgi:hypothetical protein